MRASLVVCSVKRHIVNDQQCERRTQLQPHRAIMNDVNGKGPTTRPRRLRAAMKLRASTRLDELDGALDPFFLVNVQAREIHFR